MFFNVPSARLPFIFLQLLCVRFVIYFTFFQSEPRWLKVIVVVGSFFPIFCCCCWWYCIRLLGQCVFMVMVHLVRFIVWTLNDIYRLTDRIEEPTAMPLLCKERESAGNKQKEEEEEEEFRWRVSIRILIGGRTNGCDIGLVLCAA